MGASKRGVPLDGVLVMDKQIGLSSNHVLQRARRILNARKGGHTGTLDPFATGLMILCFGEATKFSAGMFDADKSYLAEVMLGEETETGDNTGLTVSTAAVDVSLEQLNDVLSRFVGRIDQIPPMYSALKRDGKPLYAYAREGIVLEREPRTITIFEIRLVSFDGTRAVIDVSCSKGTYIRTLAQEMGRGLGGGAHLTALRRRRTAGFSIEQAITLEALEALPRATDALLPIESLISELPIVQLDAGDAARFGHGQQLTAPDVKAERLRVHGPDNDFLGTARWQDGWLLPDRVISLKETT